MKVSVSIFFLFFSVIAIAQKTDEALINQSLKLLCQEEVIQQCLESSTKKKDTICFYSTTLNPTEIIKVSRTLYYQISNNLKDNEGSYSCILDVQEMFRTADVLLLKFKVLKTKNSSLPSKIGLVRCEIIDGTKISFVDARFD